MSAPLTALSDLADSMEKDGYPGADLVRVAEAELRRLELVLESIADFEPDESDCPFADIRQIKLAASRALGPSTPEFDVDENDGSF